MIIYLKSFLLQQKEVSSFVLPFLTGSIDWIGEEAEKDIKLLIDTIADNDETNIAGKMPFRLRTLKAINGKIIKAQLSLSPSPDGELTYLIPLTPPPKIPPMAIIYPSKV